MASGHLQSTSTDSTDSWGKHSAIYDRRISGMMSAHARDALTLGGIDSELTLATKIDLLDIGCGTGALTFEAVRAGCTVTATDLSQGMLETLSAKAIELGMSITTQAEDGQKLACFGDEQYDVVASSFGIFMFPDRLLAWKNVMRVLRNNGTLIVTSWLHGAGLMALNTHMCTVFDFPLPSILDPAKNMTLTKQGFKKEVEENGFKNVKIYEVSHEVSFAKGQHLMDVYMQNPAFGSIKTAVGGEKLQQVIVEWFAKEKGFSSDQGEFLQSPVHLTTTSLICIARK
ncbi:hypothetical protein HDU67_000936 [Dinochytrium kinnereticum]|nr:hypothetical protein HDU67_000936 [Dinochytrium kinnereticum]